MKRVVVLVLFCLTLVFSCKNEEAKKQNTKVEEVKTIDKFTVTVEYKIDKAEKLQCVFSNIELKNSSQSGAYIITEKLQPKAAFSKTKFEMFDNFFVSKVQFRLGKKPIELQINEMVISFEDKEVFVSGKDVDKYFALNKYVKFDSASSTIKTVTINGKHQPTLTLRQGFINKLFNLL